MSPRVAPFADLRDLGALLQRAGFALPVADADRVVVRYDSVFGLMRDLRRMGATNALLERRRMPLRRATLLRMAEIYAARFADPDGRVRARFEIVWLSGWAPHPDQQRPLRPGSAATRLADALGTREIPARGGELGEVVGLFQSTTGDGDEQPVHLGAKPGNRGRDGDGDARGDHRVFDRGRAAFVAREAQRGRDRGTGD